MNNLDKKIATENQRKNEVVTDKVKNRRPDDVSGLNIEAKIKIFDPTTGKILVQGRA